MVKMMLTMTTMIVIKIDEGEANYYENGVDDDSSGPRRRPVDLLSVMPGRHLELNILLLHPIGRTRQHGNSHRH